MADDLTDILVAQGPQAGRPLLGLTVLVVEDSRFACEALRLLCLRSGARIRRADCLQSARRHLQTYRPTVVIVDLGLPDGSGLDLIADLAAGSPRVPVILAISGEDGGREMALAAGADGFLAKPIESLGAFQRAVLSALPSGGARCALAAASDHIAPDRIALRDDLAHIANLLDRGADDRGLDYIAQFLSGVALSAHDLALAAAAQGLAADHVGGVAPLSGLVRERLAVAHGF